MYISLMHPKKASTELRDTRGPIHSDVTDAPFRIGQGVLVWRLADGEADASFLGMKGVVEYYEYDCGCGQSFPEDPMIGVRFPDGQLEEFWQEELEIVGPLGESSPLLEVAVHLVAHVRVPQVTDKKCLLRETDVASQVPPPSRASS